MRVADQKRGFMPLFFDIWDLGFEPTTSRDSSSKLGQSKKIYGHAKPEQN